MSIRSRYESELALVFNKLVEMCHTVELAIEKSVVSLKMRNRRIRRFLRYLYASLPPRPA